MTHYYFHCTSETQAVVDRRGSQLEDLSDARARAFAIIQSMVTSTGSEDWRDWMVHVSDDEGEEILSVPFASVVGRLH